MKLINPKDDDILIPKDIEPDTTNIAEMIQEKLQGLQNIAKAYEQLSSLYKSGKEGAEDVYNKFLYLNKAENKTRVLFYAQIIGEYALKYSNHLTIKKKIQKDYDLDIPEVIIPKLLELNQFLFASSIVKNQKDYFKLIVQKLEYLLDLHMGNYENNKEILDDFNETFEGDLDARNDWKKQRIRANVNAEYSEMQMRVLSEFRKALKELAVITGNIPSNNSRPGVGAGVSPMILQNNLFEFINNTHQILENKTELTPDDFQKLLEQGTDLNHIMENTPGVQRNTSNYGKIFDASME